MNSNFQKDLSIDYSQFKTNLRINIEIKIFVFDPFVAAIFKDNQ